MQLLDVRVSDGDDGFCSVRFTGEGGESIEVRLRGAPSADPIARAKAVMTQVAAFNAPFGEEALGDV